MSENQLPKSDDNRRAALLIFAGFLITVAAAFGLGLLLKTPPTARLFWTFSGAAAGIVATLPMIALLYWFAKTDYKPLAQFRRSQVEFFADLGFAFTRSRIVLMALGAGITEELLFRGVLQTWAAGVAPIAVAIVGVNILFGALHARTLLYAVIAGCVGIYLGVLLAVTGNLLTPIVAHTLYDAVALEYTRRAIAKMKADS